MNKKHLRIAILMPVYNGGKKLREAVQSIANQTYPLHLIKLFLVDNNSTDGAVKEMAAWLKDINPEFAFEYLFCEQPGIVPALNTGLFSIVGNSEFDLVARLDADDVWLPSKLEKQVEFLVENPDVDILGTNILQVTPSGDEIGIFSYPSSDKEIKEKLLMGNNAIAHPSVVFRPKIIYRTGGYDNTYPIAEDYHLWLKALKWFKFANLKEVYVKYTVCHNPRYNPLCPQMACMAMKQAYRRLHENIL